MKSIFGTRLDGLVGLGLAVTAYATGCSDEVVAPAPRTSDHGPIAEHVSGAIGDPVPYATAEQLATFKRGREVALRRFDLASGLGPSFNVTFCSSCHERPTVGGSAGLYRNFFLAGTQVKDGAFFPAESAGKSGGVFRLYRYRDGESVHPDKDSNANVITQRNPIPFVGVGLIAELEESEILKRADPDDEDGDGVSGKPNYDKGFVGRFGRKAQTVSIEGFIRGPLFNHLGVTTDPLSEEQKARLPVDSSSSPGQGALLWLQNELVRHAQAAAPAAPLMDDDAAPDPEMSTDDLFDLVSFAMLLAAPRVELEVSDEAASGRTRFDDLGCATCHTPRLEGPRGPLPVYSDLLLHDMGEELADGIVQGDATGSEFRTQPLWGIVAVGPYLHDGRASTLEQAILMHAGEAKRARDAFAALDEAARDEVIAFLGTLGGADQASPGLLPPNAPIPAPGEPGGPTHALSSSEAEEFRVGRDMFDRDFPPDEGLGSPRFNGDSCRACHFDPVIGGAGPRGVNVIRHGILNEDGGFAVPATGTILHRLTNLPGNANRPQAEANVFELRQTPSLFGLGLVELIDESAILANADPDDTKTPDGISGRPSFTDGGRLGRFGWKAQVPSLAEFVRDAVSAELGVTLEYEAGLTFGRIQDTDDVLDPELGLGPAAVLTRYLELLGPPVRKGDPASVAAGEALFDSVGCALCHVPTLPSPAGDVALYSDLLLHEILPASAPGIEDASANIHEFRTAPLWGISDTKPYLHDGRADTLELAILGHDGEALATREAFEALSASEKAALLEFLESL